MNSAGDVFEREADSVATDVVRDVASEQHGPVTVRRACQQCVEEEARPSSDQEQAIQANPAGLARSDATPGLESYLSASHGAGRPLPAPVRAYFEPRFGHDFSGVRLHTGSEAARAAADINALAFTTGPDIHFASGRFRPGTPDGDRLLAHELTHVLQQHGAGSALSAQPRRVQRQLGDPFGPPVPDLPESDVDCSVDLAARKWQDFINCCAKTPLGKGCSKDVITAICKIPGVECEDKPGPTMICPPGFKPGATRDHKGECCDQRQTAEDSRWCCAPARIVTKGINPRCCPPGTNPDARGENCVTPPPPPKPDFCLPGQKTTTGECCRLPAIPRGDSCVVPSPPTPPIPTVLPIEFRKDRPLATSTLADSLTEGGRNSLDTLVKQLRENTSLKVQLIGRASPEGSPGYNLALGRRRAEMIAAALAAQGIAAGRLADAPQPAPFSPCEDVRTGVLTCGESQATGPEDRQVLPRLFLSGP